MREMSKNCKICMEWQEHCYWSHMDDENKHFFKLMNGDFTESLIIPDRFANNFDGRISENVNLKSPSGRTWSIGVANDPNQVVLRSGWKEFVQAHSIEDGDYLLFRYSGVSSFHVQMFDSSGCEKMHPHFAKNNEPCERIEISGRVDGARCGCRGSIRTEHHTPMPKPKPAPVGNGNAHLEMILHRDNGKNTSRRPCKRGLHHDFEEEESRRGLKGEEDLELEEEDDDDDDADGETRYYFCRDGPVREYRLTRRDKAEISSVGVPVEPGNPVFVQVMHPSHVSGSCSSMVAVSSEFVGRHLGAVGTRGEIIFRRASRRGEWHVRFLSRDNWHGRGGLYGRGWVSFTRDNGLVGHDVCLLELLKGSRRRPTMAVHVLRRLRGRLALLR